ncbi:MAG TPA: GlsB/YeaQ/YmgE family stress response membrane protein [Spirochaetota bacterium]|nr:GlsB/YeaQ/YmgE family stress response membrane protein [Spirochaetota bacterium]
MGIIMLIIVGLAAGYLAGLIWKGGGFGLIGNLLVGVAGSFLGRFLFNLVGFAVYGFIAQIVAAIAGAIVLLWIINKIR